MNKNQIAKKLNLKRYFKFNNQPFSKNQCNFTSILKQFKFLFVVFLVLNLPLAYSQNTQNSFDGKDNQVQVSSCVFLKKSTNLRQNNLYQNSNKTEIKQNISCKIITTSITNDRLQQEQYYQDNLSQCIRICCIGANLYQQENLSICQQQNSDILNQQTDSKIQVSAAENSSLGDDMKKIGICIAIVIPSITVIFFLVLLIVCKVRSYMQEKQSQKKLKLNIKVQKPLASTLDTANGFKSTSPLSKAQSLQIDSKFICEFCSNPQSIGVFLKTRCNHYFHSKCIQKCLKNSQVAGLKYQCPLCYSIQLSPLTFICETCKIGCHYISLKKKNLSRIVFKQLNFYKYKCKVCELSELKTDNQKQSQSHQSNYAKQVEQG